LVDERISVEGFFGEEKKEKRKNAVVGLHKKQGVSIEPTAQFKMY